MSGNCQFTYIIHNKRKQGEKNMIIIGLYMIICVLLPYLVAILLDIIPSVGVLVVLIIGIVMMLSATVGRNLSRGLSTGLINGTLRGFWYCINLLINTVIRILRWTARMAPRVYRRSRAFFINQCGMSQGWSSLLAFLVSTGMVVVVIWVVV